MANTGLRDTMGPIHGKLCIATVTEGGGWRYNKWCLLIGFPLKEGDGGQRATLSLVYK